MEAFCNDIVSCKLALDYTVCHFPRPGDENPCRLCSNLQTPNSQVLQINSAQTGSILRGFEGIYPVFIPPSPAISHHLPPLKQKKNPNTVWNCWNSVAVLFELRCSEFELDYSERAPGRERSGFRKSDTVLRGIGPVRNPSC
jgi:hypothetical protein